MSGLRVRYVEGAGERVVLCIHRDNAMLVRPMQDTPISASSAVRLHVYMYAVGVLAGCKKREGSFSLVTTQTARSFVHHPDRLCMFSSHQLPHQQCICWRRLAAKTRNDLIESSGDISLANLSTLVSSLGLEMTGSSIFLAYDGLYKMG